MKLEVQLDDHLSHLALIVLRNEIKIQIWNNFGYSDASHKINHKNRYGNLIRVGFFLLYYWPFAQDQLGFYTNRKYLILDYKVVSTKQK